MKFVNPAATLKMGGAVAGVGGGGGLAGIIYLIVQYAK